MRIRAIAVRIIHQFLRDKRTLALMFLAPLLVMTLMYLVFNGKTYHPNIGVVNVPEMVQSKLESSGADIHSFALDKAKSRLKDAKLDAIIQFDGTKPVITLEGSDPKINQAVLEIINQASGDVQSEMKPDIHYLHGNEDLNSFDHFGPVLLGVFVFFFVFLIAGVSLLRERTNGTLERILAGPLKRVRSL